METKKILAVEALIVFTLVMWFSQGYCAEIPEQIQYYDGQYSYVSPSVTYSPSCSPISNIPDDPPQQEYPHPIIPFSAMRASGTSLPSPSPEATNSFSV